MDVSYLIVPFSAWFVAGCLKFIISSLRVGKLAYGLIGYGGLPSNHAAIVTSTTTLIAFREGLHSAVFGVSLTVAFVVLMDAVSLRRQVGLQAESINRFLKSDATAERLRERMGHTRIEILAGITLGIAIGWLVHLFGTQLS